MTEQAPKGSYIEKLHNLVKEDEEDHPSPFPVLKIQKVQPYLREQEAFSKYFYPKLLSIGPIHHGKKNLKLGEHYKKRWAKAYLKEVATNAAEQEQLCQKFINNIDKLKKLYMEDTIEDFTDDYLAWLLFVDACALLHIMKNADDWWTEAPKMLKIKVDQVVLLLQDLLLLENQLPWELLTLLTDERYNLEECMLKVVQSHHMVRTSSPSPYSNNTNLLDTTIVPVEETSAHLLDLLYKTLVKPSSLSSKTPQRPLPGSKEYNTASHYGVRNMRELKAAGIEVQNTGKASLKDVKFTHRWLTGVLELPEIIVDDLTAPTLMNLIAYEKCSDFPTNYDIISYVAFLDFLIDNSDDVKELRSAGVLQNQLENDDEVANLFNSLSKDNFIAYGSEYYHVTEQIKDYCGKFVEWKIHFAELISNIFKSPWAFTGFMVGVIVVGLDVAQTFYAVRGSDSDNKPGHK